MTDIRERLAEIRAREQAATEGPWQVGTDDDDAVDSHWVYDASWSEVGDVRTPHDEVRGDAVMDARFIAHARQDVPALLAAVEAALALHQPVTMVLPVGGYDEQTVCCSHCRGERRNGSASRVFWPCAEVIDIAKALGAEAVA
jgi:hypothetical protein